MRDLRSIARGDPTAYGICYVAAAILGTAASAGTLGATAAGAAAIGGTAASIYGANKAAKTETNAANQANQTLINQQNQVRSDLAPYRSGGEGDFNAYNSLIGASGNPKAQEATLQSMPGYQFSLGQGLKSVQNSAASRGLGLSGAAEKGAANYATGLSQSNYGQYANNLYQGAQLGESAAAQTGSFGTQSALGQASNTTSAGVAAGNAAIAGGNALSNGLNSLYLYNALQNGGGGLYGPKNSQQPAGNMA